jgi:hypothetical protein
MDGLPLIASGLDIEQQIGPFFLEMRKEEHPAHYLGVFGMRFRPCIPFIDDALLCRAVFVRHGGLLLHLQRRFRVRPYLAARTSAGGGGRPDKSAMPIS